jgi:hypothetical protein
VVRHTTDPHEIYWENTGSDDSWRKPVQRVKDQFDIQRYSFCNNNTPFVSWVCKYKLWIDITQTWSYTFYNEDGDDYTIWTELKGVHTVMCGSSKPIVKITATSEPTFSTFF